MKFLISLVFLSSTIAACGSDTAYKAGVTAGENEQVIPSPSPSPTATPTPTATPIAQTTVPASEPETTYAHQPQVETIDGRSLGYMVEYVDPIQGSVEIESMVRVYDPETGVYTEYSTKEVIVQPATPKVIIIE